MKNLNPKTIALYTALFVAAVATLIVAATQSLRLGNWAGCVVMFLVIMVLSYILFYYALERFIYRKIKLVYKSIHNLKLNRFTKDILGKSLRSDDPLAEVQEEVEQWAEDSRKEIEGLKKAEQYRREFLSNLS